MLCVYSHLIIFYELYGFGSQGKCGIFVKSGNMLSPECVSHLFKGLPLLK